MYILDANAFISASNGDFTFDSCPEYWNWLAQAEYQGFLMSIEEIRAQIKQRKTEAQQALLDWCNKNEKLFKPTTYKDEHSDTVDDWVQDPERPYFEDAINEFLQDPDSYIISEALARGGTVVTYEISEPYRRNRVKIPDVCAGLGIECIKPHEMLRREGVRFIL